MFEKGILIPLNIGKNVSEVLGKKKKPFDFVVCVPAVGFFRRRQIRNVDETAFDPSQPKPYMNQGFERF